MSIPEFLIANGVPDEHTLTQLTGGANNRVYRVEAGDRKWVLKQYFKRADDPRDRFAAEHDYHTALWSAGIRQIPESLAWDRGQGLGLFEFIAGRKLTSEEVNRDRIDEALDFIIESNQQAGSADLKPASEACFSLPEHFATVDRRVTRLGAISDDAARAFIENQLKPRWREILNRSDRSDQTKLPIQQRCISPSDFGFHNALLQPGDTLRFFDFEYAGMDDPAKLTCDFFCQPRLPADQEYWEYFVERFASGCGWDEAYVSRTRRLLPVYQVKWCCIMLNEFLKGDSERREFAAGSSIPAERKNAQLERARRYFDAMS